MLDVQLFCILTGECEIFKTHKNSKPGSGGAHL